MIHFRGSTFPLTIPSVSLICVLTFSGVAAGNEDPGPPPEWMLRGLSAALEDSNAREGLLNLPSIDWLISNTEESMADERLFETLFILLDDSRPWVRVEATRLLQYAPRKAWTDSAYSAILDSLSYEEPWVRESAVTFFGRLSKDNWTDSVFRALLVSLNDDSPEVQARAARSFSRAPEIYWNQELVGRLRALLEDVDPFVASSAALALGYAPDSLMNVELVETVFSQLDYGYGKTSSSVEQFLYSAPANVWAPVVATRLAAERVKEKPNISRGGVQIPAISKSSNWSTETIDSLLFILDLGDEGLRIASAEGFRKAPDPLWTDDLMIRLLDHIPHGKYATNVLRSAPAAAWSRKVNDRMLGLLDSDDSDVRKAITVALRDLPFAWTSEIRDRLISMLEMSPPVRRIAAESLVAIPTILWTDDLVNWLLRMLDEADPEIQGNAAFALGRTPEGAWTSAVFDGLVTALNDPTFRVRYRAVEALGNAPSWMWTQEIVHNLLAILVDPSMPDLATAETLSRAPAELVTQAFSTSYIEAVAHSREERRIPLTMLRHTHHVKSADLLPLLGRTFEVDHRVIPQLRATMYILSGGNEDTIEMLQWLDPSTIPPWESITDQPENAHRLLIRIKRLLESAPDEESVLYSAQLLAANIAEAACRDPSDNGISVRSFSAALEWARQLFDERSTEGCWSSDHIKDIADVATWIKAENPAGAFLIEQQLKGGDIRSLAINLLQLFGWWIVFWFVFIFAFPWSRTVQAAFLFSPWLRRYLSLGVVPLLLLALPPLRRRLLAPFKSDLLAEARLNELNELGFFDQIPVKVDGGPPRSVTKALLELEGLVVIRGEAGLGKTSALRWLAAQTQTPVAFLNARDCSDGVYQAIVVLMKGVQDTDFVRAMIHAGTLCVIVDGLNEVTADTRERIHTFARSNRKASIFIGTQPIQWTPPAGTTIVEVERLPREEAELFLLSRPVGTDSSKPVHGEEYARAVGEFLENAFGEGHTEAERAAAALVLSNPFDLTLAADLLAQGAAPRVEELIERAFQLADISYQEIVGQPFPLVRFGRHAVAMRVEDRIWLAPGEFEMERPCLIAHKLLVCRSVRSSASRTENREMFRHERVWDFFVAKAFEVDAEMRDKYLDDPRFRGAYLRIAETWPPDRAKVVRDLLVNNAASSNDNITSNEFVRRLQMRLQSRDTI